MLEHGSILINMVIYIVAIGIGATIIMDFWAFFLFRIFRLQGLKYALVGRWLGHMYRGNFAHESIVRIKPIAGETVIGIVAHYAIGVVFAGFLVWISGVSWIENPGILPPLIIGGVTVLFPFLIMQPCFGMGIAGSKLPQSNIARLKSLMSHLAFGIGLYISAKLLSAFV